MTDDNIICLYCHAKNGQAKNDPVENAPTTGACNNCGMPLPKTPPSGVKQRRLLFKKWFWLIVIFCLVMMYYLPR